MSVIVSGYFLARNSGPRRLPFCDSGISLTRGSSDRVLWISAEANLLMALFSILACWLASVGRVKPASLAYGILSCYLMALPARNGDLVPVLLLLAPSSRSAFTARRTVGA